jgi:hypothetical protein
MASKGYIDALLNKLPSEQRVIFSQIFDEVLREFRIGDSDKAQNFAWFAVESTTHATANTEFSVVHGMASAPSRFIPSLRLDVSGSQLVPLRVSRVADAKRAYFTSSSTSAVFGGHFE